MKKAALNVVMMMLCASLAFIPASASDFTLQIFGNANMDDTIDEQDIEYVQGIIDGVNEPTQFADANYDGVIDDEDITHIEQIITEERTELTIVDGDGNAVTVIKPIERIIIEMADTAELLRILDVADNVVGVTDWITAAPKLFPELSTRTFVGNLYPDPDYEAIISLHPDLYLTFTPLIRSEEKQGHLPGIPLFHSGRYYSDPTDVEGSAYTSGVRTLGYIFDKEAKAEEFIKWRADWIDEIHSRTERLSEDEKPRVFINKRPLEPESLEFSTSPDIDMNSKMCTIAGGNNIAATLPDYNHSGAYSVTIDPEWLIEQDPEFIFVFDATKPCGYEVNDPAKLKEDRDVFMNHSLLANVAAVKSGNVYVFDGNVFRNDGSGGVIGAAYMAKVLHPDLFKDLDPKAIHQEYLTLQGFDYDLDDHGVFVYPEVT